MLWQPSLVKALCSCSISMVASPALPASKQLKLTFNNVVHWRRNLGCGNQPTAESAEYQIAGHRAGESNPAGESHRAIAAIAAIAASLSIVQRPHRTHSR